MSITIICVAYADNYERMAKCFAVPQDSTRTKVWWFHGETETTKQGITADLEAYKQKGVGGVVYYDQVHGKGEGAAKVFSKHWWNMLVFSSLEAKRLSLVFDINASNGYVAGGKWITPDKSMQRLETIEKVVEGGSRLCFRMPLPRRPHNYHKDVVEIRVANSLYNRMIGDASLSEADRVTCSTHQLVKATDRLVPSGIIGDVSVVKQY